MNLNRINGGVGGMLRRCGAIIAAILIAGNAPTVWAIDSSPTGSGGLPVLSGKVIMVDPVTGDLRIQVGTQEKEFLVHSDTEIVTGNRQIELDDIQPGVEVTIEYEEESGKKLTRSISVREMPQIGQAPYSTGAAAMPQP